MDWHKIVPITARKGNIPTRPANMSLAYSHNIMQHISTRRQAVEHAERSFQLEFIPIGLGTTVIPQAGRGLSGGKQETNDQVDE